MSKSIGIEGHGSASFRQCLRRSRGFDSVCDQIGFGRSRHVLLRSPGTYRFGQVLADLRRDATFERPPRYSQFHPGRADWGSAREYMTGGNFFYSAEPDEKALPYVLERIGEELIIFASDYPHGGSAFTGDLLGRSDVSERAKTKILRENGIRLLGEAIDKAEYKNELRA